MTRLIVPFVKFRGKIYFKIITKKQFINTKYEMSQDFRFFSDYGLFEIYKIGKS